MKHNWKRWGALAMALVMALTLLPVPALAALAEDDPLPAAPAAEETQAEPAADETQAQPDEPDESENYDDLVSPYAEGTPVGAEDDSRDIDTSNYAMSACSEISATDSTEGPVNYAKDNDHGKFWHSKETGHSGNGDREDVEGHHWIAVELPQATWVSALRYLPRTDTTTLFKGGAGNGFVTSYRIDVSMDGENWKTPTGGTGTWEPFGEDNHPTAAWEVANFTPVLAKYVRLVGEDTECNTNNGNANGSFMHANEIRVVGMPIDTGYYSVSGTVQDTSGAPLSGAVVDIIGLTSTTNESGQFTISNLIDDTYTVTVTKEGYEQMSGTTVTVDNGNVTNHTIQMRPVQRTISGTVTDGDSGLEGATVTLVEADAPYTTVAGASATTGADGEYTLNVNNVPGGNYKIRAAKAGFGAAIGGTAVTVTSDASQDLQAQPVALTAIDESKVDYVYDMTENVPEFTTGTTTATPSTIGLTMSFTGTSRASNQLKLSGIKAADLTVEFDATRSGGTGGFGIALRYANDSNYIYVGQENSSASNWYSESVLSDGATQSTAVQGPSFASGETRHFMITLRQENSAPRVYLWIDGVQVMDGVEAGSGGTDVTAQGPLAFVCGVNSTSVTVENLYITRLDTPYTITMPETLTGYVVVNGNTDSALKEKDGKYIASPGDVVNIYSADPTVREMTAPLTVIKDEDSAVSSTVNTLHITHNNSAHRERGNYVQFVMPAYNVTLEAELEELDIKEITSVSILRRSAGSEVVGVNGSVDLRATITPAIGVENLGVTWTSSDTAVATVDGSPVAARDPNNADAAYATATVTGRKAGTATITITTANGLSDTREVVVGNVVDNVFFQDTTAFTLYTNGTGTQSKTKALTVTFDPDDAANKEVAWWSSDPQVATVDQNGLVTAVSAGTATIYVRSQQNPKAQAYRDVTVVTLPKSLTLDVTQADLVTSPGAANYTQVVVPTITPAEASDKTIKWTTGNSAVATVSTPWEASTGSQNALITARGIGTTTITATSAADSSVSATVTVTVRANITGDVSVSGDLKYGSRLTVITNQIIGAANASLTYQWYRGSETTQANAISGATGSSYTPVLEDIGEVLTVKVSAGGYYLGELTCTTGIIDKADGPRLQADPTHRNVSKEGETDGAITGLFKGREYEYLKWDLANGAPGDDVVWKKFSDPSAVETPEDSGNYGTAEITGLGEGTYLIRRAGTQTHKPGPYTTVTIAVDAPGLYQLNVPRSIEGGSVVAIRTQVPEGDPVILWVTPDTGYQLKTLTAVYTDGDGAKQALEAVKQEDGTYTFTMPSADVTVHAEFELIAYAIGHELTHISCDMDEHGGHVAYYKVPFTITLTPDEGYNMPETLTVTVTGTGEPFTDYTYTADPANPAKRVLTFPNGVTQSVTVYGEAVLKTFPVDYEGDRVTFVAPPSTVGWHQEFVAAFIPDKGYQLPETIEVTMGDAPVTSFEYNKETGAVHIAEGVVEDRLTITVNAVKNVMLLEKVSISGAAQVGQRLTANITPAGADGYVTYQWYWVDENGSETEITGSTGRTKSVSEASLGKMIVVKATAVADGGFSGTVTSQPTGVVIAPGAAEVMPTQVQIIRDRVSIEVGGIDTLVAYVTPANATNKTVLWSTSDPSVVTVENGVITGVAPGTAVITVTTEADETITDTCIITVTESVLAQAADVVVPYDGRAHAIVVTVISPASGATVTYSSDGINFRNNNPTFSAVGEHVVWYKVTAAGLDPFYGQAMVIIEKATPEVTITADPSSLSAAGDITLTVTLPDYVDPAGLSVTASDSTLTVADNGDGTYTVSLPGAARTYTFTATLVGTDSYEGVTAACTVRVGSSSDPGSTAGGGGSTTGGDTTETSSRKDGATVTTVTKPDGTVTETVEQPDGTVSETVTTRDGDVTITVTDESGEVLAKVEIPATISAPEEEFIDLGSTPWAQEAINNMAGLGLVNGVGGSKFAPTDSMTRGSLATVLFRLSQGKTDYAVTFGDVAQGQYYTEGVAWAAKVGVVTGYSANTFAPNDTITREQLAVMLVRYAKLIGMDTTANKSALNTFADSFAVGSWAADGMAWCVENGILQGKGANHLDPSAKATRAEVAVMLDRFIALMK